MSPLASYAVEGVLIGAALAVIALIPVVLAWLAPVEETPTEQKKRSWR